ncbi:hypothetical protein V1478_012158 [Vespula squamosa]|uniref:Uncharacterized protein n=1 Tax=Vespula squamosa TaxID=30214 RepID=A0ABD2AD60_VESSQ
MKLNFLGEACKVQRKRPANSVPRDFLDPRNGKIQGVSREMAAHDCSKITREFDERDRSYPRCIRLQNVMEFFTELLLSHQVDRYLHVHVYKGTSTLRIHVDFSYELKFMSQQQFRDKSVG